MIDINTVQQGRLSQFLIEEHSIGGIRDEHDLLVIKKHVTTSLNIMIDILDSFDGTSEEKVAFLKEELKEVDKFKVG
jgi:hypothetical protein